MASVETYPLKPQSNILNCLRKRIISIGCIVALVFIIIMLVAVIIITKYNSTKFVEEPYSIQAAASILNHVNLSVDPCEDFYQFSCGSWMKKAKILPGRRSVSSFSVLGRELDHDLENLLLQSAPNNQTIHLHNEVQTFYQSCMDTVTINNRGLQPLLEELKKKNILDIYVQGGLNSKNQTFKQASKEFEENTMKLIDESNHNAFIYFKLDKDIQSLDKNVVLVRYASGCQISRRLLQSKTNDTDILKKIKSKLEKYKKLIQANEIRLKGTPLERELDEEGIQQFCTELTEIVPVYHSEDILQDYNPFKLNEIHQQCGGVINIHAQITKAFSVVGVKLTGEEIFILDDKDYIRNFCNLIKKYLENGEKRKILYDFLYSKMFTSYSSYLSEYFAEEQLKFSGSKGFEERTTHCADETSSFLDYYVGSIFITKYHSNFSRKNIETMIKEMSTIANNVLTSSDWMQPGSKEQALKKVKNMKSVIGYDDLLLNYSFIQNYHNFTFDKTKFFENVLSVLQFYSIKALTRLSLDIVSPNQVNAMYDPTTNKIYVPIGILDGVFYNNEFPIYMNYGGIGMVLGHELGHGFDDDGRKYDYNGVLREWWDNETVRLFEERASCFVEQYDKYKIKETKVNGNRTLGENIADQIALKLAYLAYKNVEKNSKVKNPQRLPGLNLTPDQMFFTSFASLWCKQHISDDNIIGSQDVHSPNMFRVIGSVSNSHEFSKAFNCPIGSAMNPTKKCSIF